MKDIGNKKILVTGADGFIGSHLTEALVAKGCQVRALSLYNSFNNWGWLENVDLNEVEVVCGDVRDQNFCREITKEIDVVFHLAALIAIPYSYIVPHSYVQTNVTGTLNICQSARDNGCERIVHTSTSEVYGTARYVPIDEGHPRQPQSPYSASKIGADAMAMSLFNAFNLPLTIARPFNTYGPRQSARAIIPTIITQLLDGKKEIKLGNLEPTRDMVFVKDTAEGFIRLAECDELIGQDCNIATGEEISIGDLAKTIIELINPDARIITEDKRLRPSKSEVFRLCGNNERLRQKTGWMPEHNLEAGISKTIEWFKDPENRAVYKSAIYNV